MIEYDNKVIYIDPYILPKNPKKADIILYTHDHYDHCVEKNKINKSDTDKISVNCKNANKKIKIGQTIKIGNIEIKAVYAYNINKPFHKKGEGAGYIITINNTKIYHAGDTDHIPEMTNYDCDVALLPIGGKYTMDQNEAVKAVEDINPKLVMPIHYNTFEGIEADVKKFKQQIENKGIDCKIFY